MFLLAIVVITMPACKKEDLIELISFRIEITRLSFTGPDGLTWDSAPNNSFPDVYAAFRVKGSSSSAFTAVSPNVSTVPFFLTGSFSEAPSSVTYELFFFDSDANDFLSGADDFIGGYEFQLPQGTNRQPELVIDVPSQLIGGKLHLTYQ